jgi:DnaJ homolog subfamily C member 19
MKFLLFIGLLIALYLLTKQALSQSKAMSPSDAAKLLGVEQDAGAETIIAAHKRLIAKVHPDTGGSAELAARVNAARDVLLKQTLT